MSDQPPADHDPSFYTGTELESLADLGNYQDWVLRAFRPYLHGRVLEVGAGTGNLAARYASSVREAVLLEPAENLAPSLQRRFAGQSHVRVETGTVDSWIATHDAQGSFDAVLMVNVLEHIPDHEHTLRALFGLLRPGGALLVFVPACPWIYGSLDALVHHVRRYTQASLATVARSAGFELRSLRYFDVAGVLPWWFVGRVLRARSFEPRTARTYDRWIVPLMSRVERYVPVPVGKNLSLVAVRPFAV